VIKTAVIYSVVGAVHILLRRRFLQISFDPRQAYAEGRWVRLWDFIFYVTFAFVITSSVAIAGVLLVFSFLVIPAVIATLFADRISVRLAIGWSVGIAACLVGLVASYRFDMPSGPTVVASLGIALLLAALVYYIRAAEHRGHALLKAVAGVAVTGGIVAGIAVFLTSGEFLHINHEHDWEQDAPVRHAHQDRDDAWHRIAHGCDHDPGCIASALRDREDWPELLGGQLGDADASHRETAISTAAAIPDRRALELLATAAETEPDDLLRFEETRILVGVGDRRGLELALDFLEDEVPLLYRDEALELLRAHAGQEFGYDPFGSAEANAEPLARWRGWLDGQR